MGAHTWGPTIIVDDIAAMKGQDHCSASRAGQTGTVAFNRMPRLQEPLPRGEIELPAPPSRPPLPKLNWFLLLLPLAGLFVMAGVYGGLRGDWLLAAPMIALSTISLTTSIAGRLVQRRQHQQQAEEQEAAYAAALEQKRQDLEQARQEQQRIRTQVDPDLASLLDRAQRRDPRLWQRRPDDGDFLHLRLGIGSLPSTVAVAAPRAPLPDPRLEAVLALAAEYAAVPQVPLAARLRDGPLGIAGPLPDRTGLARALLCNLVAHHAPDDVHLLCLYSPLQAAAWAWLKWLPHTYALHPQSGRHYLAAGTAGFEVALKELLEELRRRQNQLYAAQQEERVPDWPWLVVLVEDEAAARDAPAIHLLLSPEGRLLKATALFLVDEITQVPMGCRGVAEVQTDGRVVYSTAGAAGETHACWPEQADVTLCERIARSLAPLQVRARRLDGVLPSEVHLLAMLGIAALDAYDAAHCWENGAPYGALRSPIGVRRGGEPMLLDLAPTGHGPHGLVAGTTGSGKSELLQTIVLGLALTHHPYEIGFVLVDFKGGGAFSGLVDLPHTLGLVTDLGGRLAERALLALRAEMERRKRLFQQAGVGDVDGYQALYRQGRIEQPLPRLVIIIDEFAELVSDEPDFIDGLVGVARVGRSLGLHLILATQSPAGVVKQQIWANARFRICLRVESRQESSEMLHRPEAADLPRLPGRGYFQVGNNELFELFQVARVAGRYLAGVSEPAVTAPPLAIARVSAQGQRTHLFDDSDVQPGQAAGHLPDLPLVVAHLARTARRLGVDKLPPPWLAPLPDHVALPDLLDRAAVGGWDEAEGMWRPARCWLAAPLGLLDDPAHQRQLPLSIPLEQQDGHLIIVGAPGSGKGMLVRTLVMGLAHAHAPDALHVYLLQFGGQALQVLQHLPHAAGLFTPLDDERVSRLLRRLLDELEERKALCVRAHVDGLARLRGLGPERVPPAILVVLTGAAEFRAAFPDETLHLTRLVREGGPYGLHVILTGDRAGDVALAISSVVARRIALRLADASDYALVLGMTPLRGREPRLPCGRGWYGRPPLEFQAAAPVGAGEGDAQSAELRRIALRMNQAWQGPRPEPVETLPAAIPLARLLASAAAPPLSPLAAPLGLDGVRLRPVLIDLALREPGFVVASTPQGGKTTLLWTWALALAERSSPQQLQLLLVSGRRGSLGPLARLPHVVAHFGSPEQLLRDGGMARLQAELERRQARLDESPESSAAFPHLLVMFDDYDESFNAVGSEAEVQQGLEWLARRGRDVNVCTVVTGPLPAMGVGFNDPLVRQLKVGRSGFLLRVLDANDQNPLGVRLRLPEGTAMPAGRGYVVRNGSEELLQVATPGDGSAVAAWAARLEKRWSDAGAEQAAWPV
ncbi:MAG: type VII secretion protein EssC [Anaerolineae bacterium]|nr:type VII secretion protein EssC [Anaerolineae bacterium]